MTMKHKVVVNDRMQRGYIYWRTEPVGRNFAPAFKPDLTPKEMLRLGVFGGKYLTDCGVRQHARVDSVSKRARSTTPTSLRLESITGERSGTV